MIGGIIPPTASPGANKDRSFAKISLMQTSAPLMILKRRTRGKEEEMLSVDDLLEPLVVTSKDAVPDVSTNEAEEREAGAEGGSTTTEEEADEVITVAESSSSSSSLSASSSSSSSS